MRGPGRLSRRDLDGKQRRRYTVEGLLSLEAAGQSIFHEFNRGGGRQWAFAKYDVAKLTLLQAEAFVDLVLGEEVSTASLRTLGVFRPDSEKPSLSRLLSVFREFTLVMQEGDRLTESHSDFHVGGQTEHVLFVQHKLGLARHNALPSGGVGKRRVLHAPKPKPAGRPRGRPRGARREAEVKSAAAGAKPHPTDAPAPASVPTAPLLVAEGDSPESPPTSAMPSSDEDGWRPTSAGEAWPLPVDAPADALGGPAPGVPAGIHAEMLARVEMGVLPLTSVEQRVRSRPTAGTNYRVPQVWGDALKWGYIHPNLPPPQGHLWGLGGGVWLLQRKGG